MNLSQQEIDRINRELGVKKNFFQWEDEPSNATIPEKEVVTPTIESIIVNNLLDKYNSRPNNIIYTNILGELTYQDRGRKRTINWETECKIRDLHRIDTKTDIYVIFWQEIPFKDGSSFIFTTCITKEAISFRSVVAKGWPSITNSSSCFSLKWEKLNDVRFKSQILASNTAIIKGDLYFFYKESTEGYTFLCKESKVEIPSVYFANYAGGILKILSKIKEICQATTLKNASSQHLSNQPSRPNQQNVTNTATNSQATQRNNQTKKTINEISLTSDEKNYLNYLRNNPNSLNDKDILIIFDISAERAAEIQQLF